MRLPKLLCSQRSFPQGCCCRLNQPHCGGIWTTTLLNTPRFRSVWGIPVCTAGCNITWRCVIAQDGERYHKGHQFWAPVLMALMCWKPSSWCRLGPRYRDFYQKSQRLKTTAGRQWLTGYSSSQPCDVGGICLWSVDLRNFLTLSQ